MKQNIKNQNKGEASEMSTVENTTENNHSCLYPNSIIYDVVKSGQSVEVTERINEDENNRVFIETINLDTDRSWGNRNYTSVSAQNGRLRVRTEMADMDGCDFKTITEVALTNDEARKLAIQLLQYIEVTDA